MFDKIRLYFAQQRQKALKTRVNHEIHERLFPHLLGEKDFGYSFSSDEEMNALTEKLDVQPLLDTVERHICNMPKSYGESFRHIMHRDLHERFRMYEQVARKAVQPKECDPRFVATHA